MSFFKKIKAGLPALGKFNAIPAGIIDRAYLEEPKGFLSHFVRFLKIRLIYAALFIPLSVIDLVVSGLLATRYALGTFFISDDLQDSRLTQQKKYTSIFSKNLYSLFASLVGLVFPKLVAFYFTPDKSTTTGVEAGGSYYKANEAELRQPETVEELQAIILNAAATNTTIIPKGAGRSQGRQFIPEQGKSGLVIDLSKFNSVEIHTTEKIAYVGAGARWIDVQKEADKHKLALDVMQASNVFSAAGSVGTNIHGWSHKSGLLSNTILEMEIINAKGELETVKPDHPLFSLIAGGLGLFGVITRIKLQLVDNELLTEKSVEVHLKEYTNYFYHTVLPEEKTRMHLYRLSLDPKNLLSSGVAVNYNKDGDSPPVQTIPNLVEENDGGTRFNRILINLARRIGWIRKKYWEGERSRLLANNSPALTRNAIMQPPINALFNPSVSEAEWLQEYFVPPEQLADFLAALGQLLMENKVNLINASVRFVKQHDKSPLSVAPDSDRFAVVLCWNQSLQLAKTVKVKKWIREAQELTVKHGGAYYLPYQHVSAPETFHRAYPKAPEVLQLKTAIDPQNRFSSGFYEKYIAIKPKQPDHFRAIVASEETKKEFAGFLENVLQRVETNKLYALLEDILTYNDTHDEIYEELCRRLPEIMPSVFGTGRRILNSLTSIKKDLTEQAVHLLEDRKTINGLVEIGYPGRFVKGFKDNFKVNGPVIAVYEQQSVTDYIQTGFPRPYDQFAKLDYKAPNLAKLPNKSADVITCYVGLHHFPQDKLASFLKDVRRVLRDGGHFLLVDHDVIDEKSLHMAHMAHSIFNAVNGVSLAEEQQEIRNFRPMSYWQTLLAQYGLGYAVEGPEVPLIRAGDPSRNRMVSFVKTAPVLAVQLVEREEKEEAEESTAGLNPRVQTEPAQIGAWREKKTLPKVASWSQFSVHNSQLQDSDLGLKRSKSTNDMQATCSM
ncbi:cytokinin oxidase [Legionella beliardensis]|uniref:Cytokinin oxidase n=1 Tax=Legionella beliardensis TaxID=91822 RepID=A0A378HYR7_9GAMM|nr:FAD-binding protein [Legionella beliardensis]STX27505.1 cytokinin oxidase [Legionella beliardensis]